MSGRDAAGSAELNRLQRAVYGPDAGADAEDAQTRLRELQASVPDDAPGRFDGLPGPVDGMGATPPVLAGPRSFTPMERILWAGVGALTVVALTIAGFFLGAVTAPHPDRVLIPVWEAESATVGHEEVVDYREFTADRMKIGIGTLSAEGADAVRCLYVAGPTADLSTETLFGTCAPVSIYGTTWEVAGDLNTSSSLFGLGRQDSIRFIERDFGLDVWLSREPT
ncbi:hypothetical protein [Microbacterium sp. ZW T5_56]|uniref:hypothetical protein n=1 Tax=Microbacterium sp. ZW T5_56 TaxID=3378081 RepID=UPI003854B6EC